MKMIKRLLLKLCYSLTILILIQDNCYSETAYNIEAQKIEYENNNLIIGSGNATIKDDNENKITSNKIIYYRDLNKVETFGNSKYEDDFNILEAENFKYDILNGIIEASKNVVLIDKKKNKYKFNKLIYYKNTKIGKGINANVNLNDDSYFEADEVITNAKTQKTIFKNSKFTTCKNIYDGKKFCPSWHLKSKKTTHDKNKKKIIHKDAVLKIKNIPVLYTPYLSHPDPDVIRQSGFLPPIVKSISNIGRTISVPYFYAVAKDKDITITPVFYGQENSLLKTSYRQIFKKSFLQIENGYTKGYKKLNNSNRTPGSRNYFFTKFESNLKNSKKKKVDLNLNIQKISQENFVRVNKINTKLFKEDIRILENTIELKSFTENSKLEAKAGVFENLDLVEKSKYTYFLPDANFSLNIKKFKNFNTNLNSYLQVKKFSESSEQAKIRNLISINSQNYIMKKKGFSTTYKANVLNNNLYNNNINNLKGNTNINNYLTFAIENSLPLAKFSKENYQILSPKVFLKYTTGQMKNAKFNNKILNFSDITSMNRTNDLDTPETGGSIGYGLSYFINKNNNDTSKYKTEINIGQIIQENTNKNMPIKSSLNNKTSDFIGNLKFSILQNEKINTPPEKNTLNLMNNFKNNFATINYKFNIQNDLEQLNRNSLNLENSYNKFYTLIKFEERNNYLGNERSASFNLKKLISKNYFLDFETKKNYISNKIEYRKLSLNFENDCIVTSLAYSKDSYADKDYYGNKTIEFNITIKPFSETLGQDISKFIE